MAKSTGNSKSNPAGKAPAKAAAPANAPAAKAPVSTPVRNTAIPPKTGGVAPQATGSRINVTHEQIAARAYQIWQQRGGSPEDNWHQAERELRGK